MAGATESQQTEVVEAKPFHVNLESNDPVYVEPEDDDQPDTAEAKPEPAKAEEAKATDDEAFPGDEVEYDPNDPAQKAAYEAFRKAMLPKWQKRVEALKKAKPAQAADEPQAREDTREEAKATPAAPDVTDFYADPLGDEWKPQGAVGFDKESDLAAYADELEAFVNDRIKKGIQHTLATMRDRSGQFERMAQERTAMGVIEGYIKSLENHPEYDSLYQQLAEVAPGTRELAVRNPEKWVKMAEALTGVPRDWHAEDAGEDDEDETPPVRPQRGALDAKRLANKSLATMPRTARAPQRTPVAPAGTLRGEDAFEAAWREAQRRRG